MDTNPATASTFAHQMRGYLVGVLQWEQLDAVWNRVRAEPLGWYVSQAGEAPPTTPLEPPALDRFLDELDALLRREHAQTFCGIVYVDQPERPTFIKVFDPHNLGSACSCSSTPIPPRWVLSRCLPERIVDDAPAPTSRRHWWSRLLGAGTHRAAGPAAHARQARHRTPDHALSAPAPGRRAARGICGAAGRASRNLCILFRPRSSTHAEVAK